MHCPVCKEVTLVMSERHGIEIDYCPKCRGVWLDRGELDKIIESVALSSEGRKSQPPEREWRERREYEDYDDDRYHRRKRRGFLGELFDFD